MRKNTSLEVNIGLVCHPKIPVGRSNVVANNGLSGGVGGDLEGEGLSSQARECLVSGSPVVAHPYPTRPAPFDPHGGYVPSAADVHHVH